MLDGVTINQLRTFVAVCDEGSFSGAAKKLMRAQSAISHAIGALEQSLGVELFERDIRRAQLSPAGRSLLPDAKAVIIRTEEMKTRARSIVAMGAPRISLAADVYFPRRHLVNCLQFLNREVPTATVDLRMTTMQGGEVFLVNGECDIALTVADVPELRPAAIERNWLCETRMVTVCSPSFPLAKIKGPVPLDEFSRHVQLVVTDNQPQSEKTQVAVAGERRWLINDLSAKHDFLRGSLGWGHMPIDLVADDIADGTLVEITRRAWHIKPLTFMVSKRRGYELSEYELTLIAALAQASSTPIKSGE